MIDDLDYDYDGNRLINVTDATAHSDGFDDGNKHTQTNKDDFEYDDYGNMIVDRNKEITNITYNHLNLPKKITFENNQSIEYIYGADGSKLRKTVTDGSTNKAVDYLDGFQYEDEILSFFPHAEGYIKVVTGNISGYSYHYVYNYTDHLGNIRLKYTAHPQTGEIQPLEENHYYPFGLTHDGYQPNHKIIGFEGPSSNVTIIPTSPNVGDPYKYKFGGKEYQDEFDINFYDFGARNYEPALGRWMNVDPLAEDYLSISSYVYTLNNPIRFIDPDGRKVVDSNGNEVQVKVNTDENKNRTASYTFAKGTKKSVIREFNRNGGKVINSMINSDKGLEMVNGAIESKDNISINLSSTSQTGKLAGTKSTSSNYERVDGNIVKVNEDIEITIYQGSISKIYNNPDDDSKMLTGEKFKDEWKGLYYNDILGGIGGHEIHHALNDMGKKDINTNVEEHRPAVETEKQIYKELKEKNND